MIINLKFKKNIKKFLRKVIMKYLKYLIKMKFYKNKIFKNQIYVFFVFQNHQEYY